MCGRVRLPEDWSEIRILLRLDKVVEHDYQPLWNVPPTERLPIVSSKESAHTLQPMRWGPVPSWAKEIKVGFSPSTHGPIALIQSPPSVGRGKAPGAASL